MPELNKYILCTRPVDPSLIKKAKQKGIIIDAVSFIETEPVQTIEVQQEIEWASLQQAIVVFTSMNAVEAVITVLDDHIPEWGIYCIGNTTRQLVTDYFGEQAIYGTADSAGELADLIIEQEDTEEIIFFCGNQRRNELPVKLEQHQIAVNEIMVYETRATPHYIEKKYEGILFFSPSAVNSFFSNNQLPQHTIVFSIGKTTADTIRKHSGNQVVLAKLPGKDELVEQMIDYFA